ncbi:MAG TPA: hypothetical protein VL524_05300 [Gemmatimonadaceae bacterium]|jgi:hypothetical protein|nr:hypothetical protein [Gemmatimonadaceae bacterium]
MNDQSEAASILLKFLPEIREATRYADYLLNLEEVVTGDTDAETRIGIFARYVERQRKLAAEGRQRSYLTHMSENAQPAVG